MREVYVEPEMEIIELGTEDVITTSGDITPGPNELPGINPF